MSKDSRKTAEADWTEQGRLRAQHALLADVRRRDGDGCRVCCVAVTQGARSASTALSYHVLHPGTPLTVDGVVVVCRQCAVGLRDGGDYVICPPPAHPYYSEKTSQWLAKVDLETKVAQAEEARAADGSLGSAERKKDPSRIHGFVQVDDLPRRKGSAGFDRQVVLVKLDPAVNFDVAFKNVNGCLELAVEVVGVAENNVGQRGQDHAHPGSSGRGMACGSNEHALSTGQALADNPFNGGNDRVVRLESVFTAEVIDQNASSHYSSPSVGAECDNPEPTEGEAAGDAAAARAGYEALENLGTHHPLEISVTVAQATELERRGIPLPVGGDPETDIACELAANRCARRRLARRPDLGADR